VLREVREASIACGLLTGLLAACGPVIQTADIGERLPEHLDGALVSYAFARTEMTVSASYKSGGALTIGQPTLTGYPDLNHVHTLVYQHGALSIDTPDIKLNGVLLSQVSAQTNNQTQAAITAASSVLTQVAAAQVALAGAAAAAPRAAPAAAAKPTCGSDLQVSRIVDVTYGKVKHLNVQQGASDCSIDLQVRTQLVKIFGVAGYPKGGDESLTEDYCNQAVCFRLTGGYKITIDATLLAGGQRVPGMGKQEVVLQVLAANPTAIGFVHFNRRAFSLNSTQISFTSDGLISEFTATDPSEVVGFLGVSAAAVGVVAAAAAIK